MKSVFQKIIIAVAKRRFKKDRTIATNRQLAQDAKILRVNVTHIANDVFFILIGVISAGFGLKGFLLPNQFIYGGAMGISL